MCAEVLPHHVLVICVTQHDNGLGLDEVHSVIRRLKAASCHSPPKQVCINVVYRNLHSKT